MHNSTGNIPLPVNEPVYSYSPGSPERSALEKALTDITTEKIEIPLIIGGKKITTGDTADCIEPHSHGSAVATYHKAGPEEISQAIESAVSARKEWESLPAQMRASIFIKAANLLSGKYRYRMNAATMLNQSKNPFQAEIDSACELIDFWSFNSYYMQELYKSQPDYSPAGMLNFSEHRGLEGFVFAASPFNFTSIGGNLSTAPAIMGNSVIWKPSRSAVLSSYIVMEILMEAGLPEGVINFIPGNSSQIAEQVVNSEHFSGFHFTGSTAVFQDMWRRISDNLKHYRTYPRIVGETGGKDFIFAHESADVAALATAVIRGAFEYQGQKCSAASRVYVPDSIWPDLKGILLEEIPTIKMGPVQDFSNFMNAVIDKASFDKCRAYIEHARESADAEILCGGECDDSTGYFVGPTVILASDPHYKSMTEEIFGPIVTIYVYPSGQYDEALELCDSTSEYGLTGAIFASDRYAANKAYNALRHAAGNFYINDKPTGAVVGQQPFGGARKSGTNDKAGSMLNLLRWCSPRSVKETFAPPTDYRYPFMG